MLYVLIVPQSKYHNHLQTHHQNKYQNNLSRKIPPSERVTDRLTGAVKTVILDNLDLQDAMWSLFEEKVKKLIRSAEVDIDASVELNDATLEINNASLRV